MGDLGPGQEAAFTANRDFLEGLETTQMTKSYKMLVLQAMLNEDCFPGEITLEQLTQAVARLARRSANLRADISEEIDDLDKLGKLLERNPIDAWCGGKGTGKKAYFRYEEGVFRSVGVEGGEREAFQELVREIVDWRVGEYLDRKSLDQSAGESFVVKVNHNRQGPCLLPLQRDKYPQIPEGEATVVIEGEEYVARFVSIAVNVVRRVGEKENLLPGMLRKWFGEDAGASGTRQFVRFERRGDEWEMVMV